MSTKNNQTAKSIPSLKQSFQRMIHAAGDQGSALKHSFTLTIASAILQGLAFACLYPLFNALVTEGNTEKAIQWLSTMLIISLFELILRWQAHNFGYSEKLSEVTHQMRVKIGAQLRKIPLHVLSDKRTGEFTSVIAGNVDEVITPMGNVVEMFIRSLIVPIVIVIATAFVNWQLALALLLIFPMMIPIYRWRRTAFGKGIRTLEKAHKQTNSEIIEYAQGLPVLRAANATGDKAQKLQQSLIHLQMVQRKGQLKGVIPNLSLWTLVEGGIILVLALGVYFITTQSLTIAALAALLVISVRLSESVAIITNVSAVLDYMETGLEKIEEFLAIKPLDFDQQQPLPEKFNLEFKNLRFGYQADSTPELDQINLKIPEKSMTALVGPSGSGKTTLTRMIMRYADPQEGQLLLGNIDLRRISPDLLMQNISVVFQDVYLFDDTILNNIRMGKPDASDEQVEAAAKSAHCHEFIARLPHGYQTRVGEIGGTLSGGERQRISIARAILKDAPIVILDEPTAALDTESELAVQQAIDELVQNRTVIVIAHRLSTIVGADQIVVLEDGKIKQIGKHDELIAQDGRYLSMWQAQQNVKNWHLHSPNE
ncbi:ABC transporter related protein [uncultured Thiomicrorhabdus sp.]